MLRPRASVSRRRLQKPLLLLDYYTRSHASVMLVDDDDLPIFAFPSQQPSRLVAVHVVVCVWCYCYHCLASLPIGLHTMYPCIMKARPVQVSPRGKDVPVK